MTTELVSQGFSRQAQSSALVIDSLEGTTTPLQTVLFTWTIHLAKRCHKTGVRLTMMPVMLGSSGDRWTLD